MSNENLASNIVKLRKERGLTQEELAEKTNLNIRTIQRIESGEVKPRLFTLKALSETLDYNLLPEKSFRLSIFQTVLLALIILLVMGFYGSSWIDTHLDRLLGELSKNQEVVQTTLVRDTKFTILVDPGHGGKDPGFKTASGVNEKDIVRDIAVNFVSRLLDYGYNAAITREYDNFVSLPGRNQIVKEKNADLLISIHMGSSLKLNESGFLCYYQNNNKRSRLLASFFSNAFEDTDIFKKTGIKTMPFIILQNNAVPSVMLDLGYLTNMGDLEKLTQPEFRAQIIAIMVQSVNSYFDAIKKI
jgi:N-acetylmuramoyl-L-alanine amidase